MTVLPSKAHRHLLTTAEALRLVIESRGRQLFIEVLKERAARPLAKELSLLSWPRSLESLSAYIHSLYAQTLAAELSQIRSRRTKVQVVALRLLKPVSWLAGYLTGIQLPNLDIRLARGVSLKDQIVIHSASSTAVGVSVDWLQRVLVMAAAAPDLSDDARKILSESLGLVTSWDVGFTQGTVARIGLSKYLSRRRPHPAVSITAQSFQIIESVLRELASSSRNRQ